MIDTDELSRYRPATEGPNHEATARASRTFEDFLTEQAQTPAVARPRRARSKRGSFVMGGVAAVVLAAGSVAYATFGAGDGIFYTEPATQIAQSGDLSLVLQDSNIGPCLEARNSEGMAGGCGADMNMPLSVSTGSIGGVDGVTFAIGWGPPGAVRIEMTFPNGELVVVTSFEKLEGYDVMFFIATLPSTLGIEPPVPERTVAFDSAGNPLATTESFAGLNSP